MRILIFGRFDLAYSRNAVLMEGLRLNGVEVIECGVPPTASFWALQLLWKYVSSRPRFDAMLVAFPGQEVMLMARWLTRKPIVFDAFTSHFEGYVQDRRKVSAGSLRGRWYWCVDWLSCRLATAVLTDTREHALFFCGRFGIPQSKLFPLFLGTTLRGVAGVPDAADPFIVHFHGSNIPLQGIDVIWGAVRRLWNENIRFQMIGPFPVPSELRNHVQFEEYVLFEELAERMSRAHVCLGVFGDTAKTHRVIPNKVYEALASGRAVITADTRAMRELLSGNEALLIEPANADALSRAILRLKADSGLRERLAEAGRSRLLECAMPAIVGRELKTICEQITLRT